MPDKTKEKILQTTLQIISTEGVKGITIRKIAKISGVNVAAINYHFKSKENLINETLKLFGKKMETTFTELDTLPLSPKEKLKHFLLNFSDSQIKYPGFMRSQIERISHGEDMTPKALENMKLGRKVLLKLIKAITKEESEEKLSMILFQLMSGIILPILYGKYMEEIYEFNFLNGKTREQFITLAIEKFCR
ncbi:MAG: TetR/AcrR family transcriptional regulator [Atribacterota bacterium]|nr:TetR/AcrR family transcriptional regulator [Atribacterota bacterium]